MEAGRSMIQVADDGVGIPADELNLAVERHATSKLSSADDLFNISTLGFRGEALASIGSVSRMTILSRTSSATAGAKLKIEGGLVGKVEIVAAPPGTVIQVEGLFYNVPARLKFLKQDITERKVIDTFLIRYALAYPNVRFHVSLEGSPSLLTSGDGDRRSILAAHYGVDVARQMLDVLAEENGMRLSGLISPVSLTRSNRKEITFFINGRWVQDVTLSTALLQAYHTLLMVGRYPMATLFLQVPPGEVDVNVHPAKAEIRFREPEKVFSFVQRGVRRALLAFTPVPQGMPSRLWGSSQSTPEHPILGMEKFHTPIQGGEVDGGSTSGSGIQPDLRAHIPLMRPIGQVGTSYIVSEGPDGLYLIDQHAAHERILFEKLLKQYESKSIPAQTLLTPVVVELSASAFEQLSRQLPGLLALGFDVQPFGQNSFRVYAIPALFTTSEPTAAILSLVETFEEDETPLEQDMETRIAGRVCKRLAIKAGQVLTTEEQRALVTDLEACESPRTCPHGRPTLIHLSINMLEREFGRRGAR
jgi:DNA mismatch repair protein MutL